MSHEIFLNGKAQLCCGDSLHFLKDQPDNRYDSVVTDPPYALVSIGKRFGADGAAAVKVPEGGSGAYARASAGFMGKRWDTGETAFAIEFWQECLRVLKPGGHVVAFGGTRTYHRLACAIEDAGFEIRDQLQWIYGSGFPKSHDVSKGIDRNAGAEREVTRKGTVQREGYGDDWDTGTSASRPRYDIPSTTAAREWQGWGTALKPACEPICLARKPLIGTVAANVLQYGTGAINIDACRVESEAWQSSGELSGGKSLHDYGDGLNNSGRSGSHSAGRWPANIILSVPENEYELKPFTFFYQAKADQDDRLGSRHPTVKPVDLMQWLVRLVTPKGGLVLDPFAGTGTTAEAAFREGMRCMLVERETEYQADIRRRMALVLGGPEERRRESIKAKTKDQPIDHGPLFAASPNKKVPAHEDATPSAPDLLARIRGKMRPMNIPKLTADIADSGD